jgi:hypothetical protein
MTEQFHHVPLDHPYLGRFEGAHSIDGDPHTTNMAIGIVQDALAGGHPGDESAAARVLTGPSAAAAVQTTMTPFLNEAVQYDQAAESYSAGAVSWAVQARSAAEQRQALPDEAVQLSDGSSLTRGQVQTGHCDRLAAAARRETRGDFEHRATPPALLRRLTVVVVLAVIEVFLLIWPVTDASWSDPKSVAYVIGLVLLFLFMNEQLPQLAGQAVREAREGVHAAWELTRVGLTVSRDGDPDAGRWVTGHVDERFVRDVERRKRSRCGVLGVVVMVYSAVMFTRVERLAAGLGWPLPSVLAAAALVTVFTAGGLVVLAWWWSRGNALGDQLREYGTLTDDSRRIAEELAAQSRAQIGFSEETAHATNQQLDLAEHVLNRGYLKVGVGLQKAAKILDQEFVLTPGPENLFPASRPAHDRAVSNISQAQAAVLETENLLAGTFPFAPAWPLPDPWGLRSAPRRARANPAFVDPYQLSALHSPRAASVPAWRGLWGRLMMGLALATLAVLVLLGFVAHN